eukprot:TRINITY_DN1457_c1_g1_i2.p1 TRINITY_DN1457_c1_g1~~TRINITY_DN1457_c1_g1_i2.p1  ORF type:complete len:109 (-),score=67.06 TRINITY_DN1457_c1_g1_i2:137-463(-)
MDMKEVVELLEGIYEERLEEKGLVREVSRREDEGEMNGTTSTTLHQNGVSHNEQKQKEKEEEEESSSEEEKSKREKGKKRLSGKRGGKVVVKDMEEGEESSRGGDYEL